MLTPQVLVAKRLSDQTDVGLKRVATPQAPLLRQEQRALAVHWSPGAAASSFKLPSEGLPYRKRPRVKPRARAACVRCFFVLVYMEQMFQMYGAYEKISV